MSDTLHPETQASTRQPLWRWRAWRQISRRERAGLVGPLLSVLLFFSAIVAVFYYLNSQEQLRERETLRRDAQWAQQRIRLQAVEAQEQLLRLAREVSLREVDVDDFVGLGDGFLRDRPELLSIAWTRADKRYRSVVTAPSALSEDARQPGQSIRDSETLWAFDAVRDLRVPVYSRPYLAANNATVVELQVPLFEKSTFSGSLAVQYSLDAMLRFMVPPEVLSRYAVSLVNSAGEVLASNATSNARVPGAASGPHADDIPVSPMGNSLLLRVQAYRTSGGLVASGLFWMVAALSLLTLWMLWNNLRATRRSLQTQDALIAETNFRRAMENSMLTGMRAMDLEGRVTYVNQAFCNMTGFMEHELVGLKPPYPYWPPERVQEHHRLLQDELMGKNPAGGVEVAVMRKDGSRFDARMYVSALVDARGRQTGWVTSMTDITQAKQIREELSAAHERFTKVLEGLDAAVSVVSLSGHDLLFANRSYRQWFGPSAAGHAALFGELPALPPSGTGPNDSFDESVDELAGLPTEELTGGGSDSHEVFLAEPGRWFEVRSRYLAWVDGRLAQMLIATDISARREAQELAARQAEKAQQSSRLMTMGEMASSVAHELNQPLSAISNYCSGLISRVQGGHTSPADLIGALEKTQRQAERAAQIIQRIRAFVKKSEPNLQPVAVRGVVDNAMELAEIELRRRRVRLSSYVSGRLPMIKADPILIEQVLLNLLKNAAEAIDTADRPPQRRHVELKVVPVTGDHGEGLVQFSVTDTGSGLPPEVLGRLFEAFFSTKAEGLGIGLNLCRSIIEFHQGRMKAENLTSPTDPQVVEGCRFTFWLPELDGPLLEPQSSPVDAMAR
jgi:PAS domain S-box-containing protein